MSPLSPPIPGRGGEAERELWKFSSNFFFPLMSFRPQTGFSSPRHLIAAPPTGALHPARTSLGMAFENRRLQFTLTLCSILSRSPCLVTSHRVKPKHRSFHVTGNTYLPPAPYLAGSFTALGGHSGSWICCCPCSMTGKAKN